MNMLSKFNLSNDIALVTGGAGLLGLQHCEALLEAGARVIIMDINKKALAESSKIFSKKYSGKFLTMNIDITKENQIILAKEKIYKEYNSYPTILVNNAAIDPKYESDTHVNKTRLVYTGTLALKHNPDLLCKIAYANPDVEILIVGTGSGYQDLQKNKSLPTNIKLIPLQPFKKLNTVLNSADFFFSNDKR